MPSKRKMSGAGAALISALLFGASILPARAAEVGPYFPLPNSFDIKGGSVKDSLMKQQVDWLADGIAKLEKARREASDRLEANKSDAALAEKLKSLDEQYEAAVKERETLTSEATGKEAQLEQKRLFILNVNRWINALGREATEQLKIAIMTDGAERDAAERRNMQLSARADELEKAKQDQSIEMWGRK